MNWIQKRFWNMGDLLCFVNDNRITQFGVVSQRIAFWFDGFILIYKK